MDPLLSLLENSGIGLSVNSLNAGGFIHADDIRTLASSSDSLQSQITVVEEFCKLNFLQLKCPLLGYACCYCCMQLSLVCIQELFVVV